MKVPQPRGKKEVASNELKLAAARVMMRDEQYSEARRMFKEVLEKEPENVNAVLGIAQLDQLAMRPEEAAEGYRKAITLAPKDPKVMNLVAEYYVSQNDFAKAAELYERAIELDPDQKAYHYSLAVVLTKDGRLNESIPHFTQSVGAAAAHYNVGRILFDQKRLDESEQQFLQALNKDPKLAEAQQWLQEVRRARDAELARRGLRNAPGTHPMATSPVAQTAGVAPPSQSQPIMSAGNTQQILPGGNPQIMMRSQPIAQQPSMNAGMNSGYPTGSNFPSQVAVNPAINGVPAGMVAPNSGGLSPAQLEQMRNQQLRAQQQANGPWNSPQAY